MRIEIHHHIHSDDKIVALLQSINQKVDQIMATQADATKQLTDIATALDAVSTEVGKVKDETTTLVQEVAALQSVAANAPINADLQAAIDAVSSRVNNVLAGVQAVEALVPPAPEPAPAPAPGA